MKIYGETDIGWDANALINEPVEGVVLRTKWDPAAPKHRVYDDPEVEALREKLRVRNSAPQFEICESHETTKIAGLFRRDGFVVVKDVLNFEQLEFWKKGCASVLSSLLAIPSPDNKKYITETGRLPHRYSYGTSSASTQMFHHPIWSHMIGLPIITSIVSEIFGSPDYRIWGTGGDVCLPGAVEYQHLHHDLGTTYTEQMTEARIRQARRLGVILKRDATGALDADSEKKVIEITPPVVTVNIPMSDLTWENGPIRQIPGTHTDLTGAPLPEDETEWMKTLALSGITAGSGIFRDLRAWHGGTPNVSKEVRILGNIEYGAPWWGRENYEQCMPHAIWENLPLEVRRLCEWVKSPPGVHPPGAGEMHPLESERVKARLPNPKPKLNATEATLALLYPFFRRRESR